MMGWVHAIKRWLSSWVAAYAVYREDEDLLSKALYDHEKRKKNFNRYPYCVYSMKRNRVVERYYQTREEAQRFLAKLLANKKCTWLRRR